MGEVLLINGNNILVFDLIKVINEIIYGNIIILSRIYILYII